MINPFHVLSEFCPSFVRMKNVYDPAMVKWLFLENHLYPAAGRVLPRKTSCAGLYQAAAGYTVKIAAEKPLKFIKIRPAWLNQYKPGAAPPCVPPPVLCIYSIFACDFLPERVYNLITACRLCRLKPAFRH